MKLFVIAIAVAASLQGCSLMPREDEHPTAGIDYRPVWPDASPGSASAPGTIYSPAGSFVNWHPNVSCDGFDGAAAH